MIVSNPSENNVFLKNLILKLKLTLELSQIQEILSIFQELLFLYVKYNLTVYDGRTTTWTYDSRNRKTSETVSGSSTEEKTEKTFEYDDAGNLTAETAGGYRTEYTYDALNRLSETEKPDGQKLTNTYDKLGRVTKTEDAEGNTKQYEYNSLNFVIKSIDEGGDITDYGCSVWGEQTYRREHNSGGSGEQVWNITYNAYGEATKEEKNDGSIWMYEYDERGLVIGKTEPNGTEASYTYDACGRVTGETRKNKDRTKTERKTYTYDKNGFMLTASDNGVTTSYNGGTSNAYGLITQSRTTAGGKTLVTSYEYDKGLRVKEIAYPDARTVSYGYNGTGFLESIGSDGNTTAYAESGTYNSAGQLTSLMAGNGKITTRTWGSTTGLLDSYSWGLPEYNERTLVWDNRGNITSIVKGTSSSPYTDSYTYDMKNRLTSETSGAKVRKGSSILTNASYRYAANDVSGKADGAFSSETVRLDYNASSVIIDLGSDMEVNQVNIYGRNSRISPEYLELWTKKAGSESWEKAEDESLNWKQTAEGWTVYFTGGITAKKVKLHSTWDERDADYSAVDKSTFSAPAGNIFEVMFTANGKTNFWTYDAKGNRLTENETTGGIYTSRQVITYYPNTDLIKQYGEWYFNYDRNGSLTARGNTAEEKPSSEEENLFASWNFDAGQGEVWYYEYDMSGRMTKSSSSKKGTDGLTERATYAYDYRGLLVKKTYAEFTADEGVSITGGSTASVTEWYEYTQDGRLLYTEKSSGSEVKKTDYIWAETTLWCEVDDGEVYYHHTDHLGTTEAVTDSMGKVVWYAEYEAFGSVLSENGSMAFTPSFTGKMMDDCSGLYYFNARWYDSECGRFTTSDPVRDGVAWYVYCENSPVVNFDADGKVPAHIKDYPGWSHHAPQKIFGYHNAYDAMSTLLIFNINGTKIEGETFTIRMWKGTYGLTGVGGELGLYSPKGRSFNKNDLENLGITSSTFDLFDNETGEKLVYRTEEEPSFWTTAFSPSKHRNKSNITAEFNLNFKDEESATDFYNQIKGDKKSKKAQDYYWNYSIGKKNQQNVNVVMGADNKSVTITYGNKPPEANENKGKKEVSNE